ncbi:MAG: hypothetical protein OXH69_04280 [Acidobacteria bacterium]|nr:hypothetical protein [Acidobacteriota bacterium]
MTESVPASATVVHLCDSDYGLVVTPVPFGTPLRQCKKSVAATSTLKYVCSEGYSPVRIPLGGQYCRKSVPAAATYSCPSGYTRSAATCHRYVYRSLTGATCPAGYSVIYNGLYFLCRKKLTAAATATYSCTSGRLSGSQCVFTATPTTEPVYSCTSGRLSGSQCVFTATPTTEPVYSCTSGRLSGSQCVFTATPTTEPVYSCTSGRLSGSQCVFTATPTTEPVYSCTSGRLSGSNCVSTAPPTSTVTYDCDTAPAGYALSGRDCVKTTTRNPIPTTEHYCDPGYNPDPANNTCSRTITTTPTKITVDGCDSVPPGEPDYELTITTTATGTTRTCTRTITIAAETTPTCSTAPEGEPPYQLTVTDHGDGPEYMCTQQQDDDTSTLPPPLS